jgi:HEAT repeat protein
VDGRRLTLDAVDVDGDRFDGTVIDREGVRAAALIDTAWTGAGLKRLYALKALEPYGRAEALTLSSLADSGDVESRRAFARVVSRVQGPEAVPLLRRLAGDPDAEVRRAAAYGLAGLGAPATDIYVRLLRDADVETRRSAAVGLRVSPDSVAAPALGEALGRPDSLVRYQAVIALGALSARGPVDLIVRALKDGTAFVRRAALSALIDAGRGEAALPTFLEDLKGRSAGTRQAGAEALGRIASPAAAGPLLEAARSDADSRVRESATVALGAIRAPESVPNLLKLLRDRDARVRGAAARGLGAAGNERVIPRLVAALDDTVASVRDGAASALGRLTDQAELTDPVAWKAWWRGKPSLQKARRKAEERDR